MLCDLIEKAHKSEPSLILYFRRSAIIISFLALAFLFLVSLINLNSEQPTVSISYLPVDELAVPDVYISYDKAFTIQCLYQMGVNDPSNDCGEYVKQPQLSKKSSNPQNNIGVFYPKINLSQNGNHTSVNLVILFNNRTAPQDYPVIMNLFDQDYDVPRDGLDISDPFIKSLVYMNQYTLVNNNTYRMTYSRKFKYSVADPVSSYIGLQTSYNTEKYIESEIRAEPSGSNSIRIQMIPHSFIVEVEKEQRSNTLITTVGSISGYYNIAVSIYVFLFGMDLISPWGFIHKGFCGFRQFKKRTRKNLLPFVDNDIEEQELSLEQRIKRLENFKFFLKDNIVDTSLLKASEMEQQQLKLNSSQQQVQEGEDEKDQQTL